MSKKKSKINKRLDNYKLISIDNIRYSFEVSKNKFIALQSCPLKKLEEVFEDRDCKVNKYSVSIYMDKERATMNKNFISELAILDAVYTGPDISKDKAHNFIRENFKGLTIDDDYKVDKRPIRIYNRTYIGTFLSIYVKNDIGLNVATIAYTIVNKNTLGNARVVLTDACLPYLNKH